MAKGVRLTQEEFEDRIRLVNKDVKILGEYKNHTTKIRFLCPFCGKEHESLPQALLNGHYCKTNIGNNNPFKKTTEKFVEEVSLVDPNIEVIGKYVNANVPIEFICKCGNHQFKAPAQMLLGHTKCSKCTSHKYYFREIKDKAQSISPEIDFADFFDDKVLFGISDTLNCICGCGKVYKSRVSKILEGRLCPSCASPRKKTHAQFVEEMNMVNPNIKILGKYLTADKDIECLCECGNIFYTTPHSLLSGTKCRKCAGNKRKTTEEFIAEMKTINPKIIITGKYVNAETPIEYICECGNKHTTIPSLLLYGHRCGHCNMSKSEYRTDNYLSAQNIEHFYDYTFDDCKNKNKLKFDFYIPSENLCIELDGEHHYMPVHFKGIDDERAIKRHNYTKKLDEIKNNYCQNRNIRMVRIPYWDFDNIEKILSYELHS